MRLPAAWKQLNADEKHARQRRLRVKKTIGRAITSSRRAIALPVNPVESAKVAGLRYVSDIQTPGIRRIGNKTRIRYVDPAGRTIADRNELARIRALAIPPAWTDVWICPRPDGHLQATGRDARGRKQYRYHPRWREVRDEVKYGRLLSFAQALQRIRARTEADLQKPGLPREKVRRRWFSSWRRR
jgi:DNA topoisomerase-1